MDSLIRAAFGLVFMLALVSGVQADSGELAGESCEYWVGPAPSGDDLNPGTADRPWATLTHAAKNAADSGCIVWVLDGTYTGEQRISRQFTTPITFKAVNAYRAHFENNDTVLNINGARNLSFEGFAFRHSGPEAGDLVVSVHSDEGLVWAEDIIFRNNVFHDSFSNDLLKPYNGVRNLLVEGNLFYNQGAGEEHIDVNSVSDMVIRGNIFFNDYTASGRAVPEDTKHFIIVKDSGEGQDGLLGSERVTIEGNIFLSQSGAEVFFIRLGGDGKAYHEAREIWIANNLFLGNSAAPARSILGVSGGKDISFSNNTIAGDLPSRAYAFVIESKGSNPPSENVSFYNNIWSDPTATMGIVGQGDPPRFSHGDPNAVTNLILDNNLYWNGGERLPPGTLVDPARDDRHGMVANPGLNGDQAQIVLPGLDRLLSVPGITIHGEFVRLVEQYGALPNDSPARGQANPAYAPGHDILGHPRAVPSALGAVEPKTPAVTLGGVATLSTIYLRWTLPEEVDGLELFIEVSADGEQQTIEVPATERFYTLSGLEPYTRYNVKLLVRREQEDTVTSSNILTFLTSDIRLFLPQTTSAMR